MTERYFKSIAGYMNEAFVRFDSEETEARFLALYNDVKINRFNIKWERCTTYVGRRPKLLTLDVLNKLIASIEKSELDFQMYEKGYIRESDD